MKLRKNSTQQQTSEYKHPWYESVEQMIREDRDRDIGTPTGVFKLPLTPPNPPTKEAIEKAQFVDKTYHWTGN